MARPTLIGLNPDKYSQGLRYYSFMVNSLYMFTNVLSLLMVPPIRYVFQTK